MAGHAPVSPAVRLPVVHPTETFDSCLSPTVDVCAGVDSPDAVGLLVAEEVPVGIGTGVAVVVPVGDQVPVDAEATGTACCTEFLGKRTGAAGSEYIKNNESADLLSF